MRYLSKKTVQQIAALVFASIAVLALFNGAFRLYQQILNQETCKSLGTVAENEEYLKYVASVLELYFNSLSEKKRRDPYRKDPNTEGAKLYETSSIIGIPVVDGEKIGLDKRISHYISFVNEQESEGFSQLGIWVGVGYLVFDVIPTINGRIKIDWKDPVVECSKGESIIGQRS